MKKFIIILLSILILGCFVTSFLVSSHSGKTDEYGGHNDNINGGYHYHHGLPEHQHPNGVCPFDYEEEPEKESFIGIIVVFVVLIVYVGLALITNGKSVDISCKIFFGIVCFPFFLLGKIIEGICWIYDKIKQNND